MDDLHNTLGRLLPIAVNLLKERAQRHGWTVSEFARCIVFTRPGCLVELPRAASYAAVLSVERTILNR
jgi:hypothetical protein